MSFLLKYCKHKKCSISTHNFSNMESESMVRAPDALDSCISKTPFGNDSFNPGALDKFHSNADLNLF